MAPPSGSAGTQDNNRGRVWLEDSDFDNGNEPHFQCDDSIRILGSRMDDSSGTWMVVSWAPTNNGVQRSGTWTYNQAGPDRQVIAVVGTLPAGHYRLDVQNKNTKHKMFWVEGCETAATTQGAGAESPKSETGSTASGGEKSESESTTTGAGTGAETTTSNTMSINVVVTEAELTINGISVRFSNGVVTINGQALTGPTTVGNLTFEMTNGVLGIGLSRPVPTGTSSGNAGGMTVNLAGGTITVPTTGTSTLTIPGVTVTVENGLVRANGRPLFDTGTTPIGGTAPASGNSLPIGGTAPASGNSLPIGGTTTVAGSTLGVSGTELTVTPAAGLAFAGGQLPNSGAAAGAGPGNGGTAGTGNVLGEVAAAPSGGVLGAVGSLENAAQGAVLAATGTPVGLALLALLLLGVGGMVLVMRRRTSS